MVVRFVYPGALDELQVVEQRNHIVQNGEGYERIVSRRGSAEEQVELSEETGKRRDACQAEHRNRKSDTEARVLLRKSAERVECFFAVVPDDAEHEEREVVRNGVDKEVIDDCRLCHCSRAEQCHHDVAGLGDGAVCHESAETALLECAEVSDKERDASQEGDERCNLVLNRGERAVNEHDEECDCSCLRSHGENGGYRRRGAFVNIRSPGVEREQRELESNAAEQEQHRKPQERICARGNCRLDFVEVEASGKTVEVAESEQFKCRGDRTHQNVLGGGFGTELVTLVPCGQGVHRNGCDFETEEEREQVAGADDRESAECCKCNRSDEFCNLVHLRLVVATVFKVILRKPNAKEGADHEHFAHQNAKVVDLPVAYKELSVSACERDKVQQEKDDDKADVRNLPRQF